MSRYEEGLKLVEERCANKDNLVSLATIAIESGGNGQPVPVVRDVDAYYEDGAFYVVTYSKTSKMLQIEKNSNVAFAVNGEWFSGNGTGINLGWVLKPENAEIRTKLRQIFSEWYDFANNEQDQNCCFLKVQITRAIVIKNHGEARYDMDFLKKVEMSELA